MRTTRMDSGKKHEAAVADRLRSEGWHVEPFGIERFQESVLRTLHRSDTKRMIRWVPDMLAARDERLRFVEAKNGITDTPNHSIELDCLVALTMAEVVWDVQVVIVWGDFTVNRPRLLKPCDWFIDNKSWTTGGSNTPFALVRKVDQLPFESAFPALT